MLFRIMLSSESMRVKTAEKQTKQKPFSLFKFPTHLPEKFVAFSRSLQWLKMLGAVQMYSEL